MATLVQLYVYQLLNRRAEEGCLACDIREAISKSQIGVLSLFQTLSLNIVLHRNRDLSLTSSRLLSGVAVIDVLRDGAMCHRVFGRRMGPISRALCAYLATETRGTSIFLHYTLSPVIYTSHLIHSHFLSIQIEWGRHVVPHAYKYICIDHLYRIQCTFTNCVLDIYIMIIMYWGDMAFQSVNFFQSFSFSFLQVTHYQTTKKRNK